MRKLGLILGILFGALFGLMFAPFRGRELRKRMQREQLEEGSAGLKTLGKSFKKMGHEVAELAQDVWHSDEVQEMVDQGREKAAETVQGGLMYAEKKTRPQRKKVKRAVSNAKRKVNKAKTKVKKAVRKAKSAEEKAVHKAESKVKKNVTKAKRTVKKAKKTAKKAKSVVTKKRIGKKKK